MTHPDRARRLARIAAIHDAWVAENLHRAGFDPARAAKVPGSDYNQHHLDAEPPPGAEAELHRRIRLADEAARSGHSHANDGPAIDLAGVFTESLHPRAAGGKFGSKGGTPVAAARARNAPKTAAVHGQPGPAGPMTRAQQLRYQASQDRQLAHQVMIKIAALARARDAAIAGISPGKAKAPVNAAKSAAAKKAALARKTGTAKAKAKAAVRKTTGTKTTRIQRLNGQIKLLKNDARLLLKAANHLDAEAAKS